MRNDIESYTDITFKDLRTDIWSSIWSWPMSKQLSKLLLLLLTVQILLREKSVEG